MRIGDVVISRDGPWSSKSPLVCGSGMYTHAICVSVEPFVLISEEGDMAWSCLTPSNYIGLCRAHPAAVKAAFDRYERETGKRPVIEEPSVTDPGAKMAIAVSRYIHNVCKDVPHDIGLRVMEIISGEKP